MLRTKKKAFTLIELIVVIVILGLLAALAIPTFKTVIDNARSETDKSSFAAQSRAQVANAAFTQGQFDADTVEATIRDTNGWTTTTSAPTAFGEIAYSIGEDSLSLVTRSSDGSLCLTSVIEGTSPVISSAPYAVASCFPTNIPTPPDEVPDLPEATLAPISLETFDFRTFNRTSGEGEVELAWEAVPNAASYVVTEEGATPRSVTRTRTNAYLSVTSPGERTFSITALDADGETISQPFRTAPVFLRLAGPNLTIAFSGANVPAPSGNPDEVPIRLNWALRPGAVSYDIYKDDILIGSSETSYFGTHATLNTPFSVKTIDAAGVESFASDGMAVTNLVGSSSAVVYNQNFSLLQ